MKKRVNKIFFNEKEVYNNKNNILWITNDKKCSLLKLMNNIYIFNGHLVFIKDYYNRKVIVHNQFYFCAKKLFIAQINDDKFNIIKEDKVGNVISKIHTSPLHGYIFETYIE